MISSSSSLDICILHFLVLRLSFTHFSFFFSSLLVQLMDPAWISLAAGAYINQSGQNRLIRWPESHFRQRRRHLFLFLSPSLSLNSSSLFLLVLIFQSHSVLFLLLVEERVRERESERVMYTNVTKRRTGKSHV